MKKLSDTIVVHTADGRKIGEIRAWTGVIDLFDKTKYGVDGLGWMTEKGPSFKYSDDVILAWAWRQVIASANDLPNNMPSTCLICGEKSINIERKPFSSKDKFIGIACKNQKCKMYNVLIPAEMCCASIDDVPWDKLSE